MLIPSILVTLLAGVLQPTPINDGFNNGLLLYMPPFDLIERNNTCNSIMRSCPIMINTGVSIEVENAWLAVIELNDYMAVVRGYGKYASAVKKQSLGRLRFPPDPIKVRTNTDAIAPVPGEMKPGDPFAIVYFEEITIFGKVRVESDDIESDCIKVELA